MTLFEQYMPLVNAGVDANLGDSLTYETAPGVPLANAIGFVTTSADETVIDGISPLRQRWSLKISKALLPAGPSTEHRFTCAKLGGVIYRPTARVPIDGGDYWLTEIQKAT